MRYIHLNYFGTYNNFSYMIRNVNLNRYNSHPNTNNKCFGNNLNNINHNPSMFHLYNNNMVDIMCNMYYYCIIHILKHKLNNIGCYPNNIHHSRCYIMYYLCNLNNLKDISNMFHYLKTIPRLNYYYILCTHPSQYIICNYIHINHNLHCYLLNNTLQYMCYNKYYFYNLNNIQDISSIILNFHLNILPHLNNNYSTRYILNCHTIYIH